MKRYERTLQDKIKKMPKNCIGQNGKGTKELFRERKKKGYVKD